MLAARWAPLVIRGSTLEASHFTQIRGGSASSQLSAATPIRTWTTLLTSTSRTGSFSAGTLALRPGWLRQAGRSTRANEGLRNG